MSNWLNISCLCFRTELFFFICEFTWWWVRCKCYNWRKWGGGQTKAHPDRLWNQLNFIWFQISAALSSNGMFGRTAWSPESISIYSIWRGWSRDRTRRPLRPRCHHSSRYWVLSNHTFPEGDSWGLQAGRFSTQPLGWWSRNCWMISSFSNTEVAVTHHPPLCTITNWKKPHPLVRFYIIRLNWGLHLLPPSSGRRRSPKHTLMISVP